jgi:hypothetical protein
MRTVKLTVDDTKLVIDRSPARPLASLARGVTLLVVWYIVAGMVFGADFNFPDWLPATALILPVISLAAWVPPLARALQPKTFWIVQRDGQLEVDGEPIDREQLQLLVAGRELLLQQRTDRFPVPLYHQRFHDQEELREVAKAIAAFADIADPLDTSALNA